MTRFIFITGGVVSSLGKGLASASLAALLQARGYKVRLRKLDPYLNVDPGTMSPYQHGEVFVTDDGAETDLDLGHYERFTGVDAKKSDNVTAGQIYMTLLGKERRGDYLGGTVQVIPHVTDLIKEFVTRDTAKEDFVLCEIGGTVGDIEGLPFFEAIRQIGYQRKKDVLFMHLTLVPYIAAAKELKTKPTQHSVKELRSIGIQPDILLCRADREIPESERKKIALFCNISAECVIQGLDVKSIYQVPQSYREQGLDTQVLKHFGLQDRKQPNLSQWHSILKIIDNPKTEVNIGIVGKYTGLGDAYKSLDEALSHGGFANNAKVNSRWISAESLERPDGLKKLTEMDAILVPGGFGERGVKGKIAAITYARENKVPYFGICFGMQTAVIEFARNVLDIRDASSTEFAPYKGNDARGPLIGLMTEWQHGKVKEKRKQNDDLGGTMRLGAYECDLVAGTQTARIYGAKRISERHRHRYEVNTAYRNELEKAGLIFSGLSPDGKLPEIVELKNHPWFIAVQFHPELKSRPFAPHPLFASFIEAAVKYAKKSKHSSLRKSA